MNIYKKLRHFISLVCAVLLIFSTISFSVAAVSTNSVTAATGATVKQGYSYTCYVDIGSTEDIAALDVTVHFDPAKVKITNVYNSINCTLYDSVTNADSIQFSYIFDGEGAASKTRLFYFNYQVLNNADLGNSYFDITIGEAYDNSLNDVSVSGSRCNFTITETVTNKSCSVYSSSPVSASVEKEFTLNYRFSTYQIASGTAVISYDPELFEVIEVTNGAFLTNKIVDVNTGLNGEIYISFLGTEYYSNTNFISVTFKTIKNVTETSKIVFKAVELIDKELNSISCSGYTTNVKVAFDNTYTGDAPAMKLDGAFSYENMQITLAVTLEENSRLGAGDFVIAFDPALVSYHSCTKGFEPSFFNINDKNVDKGELKFHIISLSDIVTQESVLTVVFDVNHPYNCATADFELNGTGLSDSLTEKILLNFIDDSVPLEYQVKFLDETGAVLQSGLYYYGDTVTEPDGPLKDSDEYGTYTFSGWDKAVVPCTADATYTATYTLEYTDYTILFKNHDDSVISEKTYHYGDAVEIPETPIKEKDGYYAYTFAGWDKEVSDYCSGNAEYKATFTAEHYHTYEKTVTLPTCTTQGFSTYVCICQDTYISDYADPLGHTPGTAATCTEDQTCTVCGEVLSEKLGHDYKSVVTAPTCESDGFTTYTCANCGDSYIADEISALGHAYVGTVTASPTCTTAGVKTYVCTNDESHTYTEAVAELGHNPGADATCTEDQTCIVCGEVLTEKLGHDYKSVVTAPTCEVDGYTTYTCSACEDSYVADAITAIGHSWNDGVVTTEPTVETEGVMTCTCSVCGATKTEVIEKLQPAFTESEDAILTDDGNICVNVGKAAESLLAQASDGATLVDKNGNALSAEQQVGTGAVLTLADGTQYEIFVPGDVDGDGNISASDARLALRASVGLETYDETSVQYKAAKVESADKISASDARLILRASVGLEDPKDWLK